MDPATMKNPIDNECNHKEDTMPTEITTLLPTLSKAHDYAASSVNGMSTIFVIDFNPIRMRNKPGIIFLTREPIPFMAESLTAMGKKMGQQGDE